ncbi:4-oxalocrotonate tautomerase [Domibacillus epiphyticus]|uniref:Tautomerase n=1 Tax=Domibacillus epiphyticus TaxID=1714355 RepID=A0A1V2A881_9BACI|nr:4-oxalocrotonate tautomerase [Domibacillus epiphyticus]OMP67211.1 4-oxalocrotonate tautomerase [Domibacillus epiphyticus]
MPIVNIQILEGRPPEKVEELIKNMTDTAAATLDAPHDSVRVVVTEIPKTHWGRAGVPMSKLVNK